MPSQLALIRHSKAEQGTPDHTRALTKRGARDAAAIGSWLHDRGFVPDLAAVSPSTRTRQTWEGIATALGAEKIRVVLDERIWTNASEGLLELVAEQDGTVGMLAVVGHNPSIHEVAFELAGATAADRLGEFPTSTVAVFSLDDWTMPQTARLVDVATCRG